MRVNLVAHVTIPSDPFWPLRAASAAPVSILCVTTERLTASAQTPQLEGLLIAPGAPSRCAGSKLASTRSLAHAGIGDPVGAQLCVQRSNKSQEADVQRSYPVSQLNDVEAPLASLDLADRCLTLAQQDGKVGLPQPLPLAQAPEHVQEDGVVSAVESLAHENLSGDTLRDRPEYSEREFISQRRARRSAPLVGKCFGRLRHGSVHPLHCMN